MNLESSRRRCSFRGKTEEISLSKKQPRFGNTDSGHNCFLFEKVLGVQGGFSLKSLPAKTIHITFSACQLLP